MLPPPPVHMLSAADTGLGPPASLHRDPAPSPSCERQEWGDAAGPDAGTDPSRNRRARTTDGYDAAMRCSGTGRCVLETRPHPAATADRAERPAWCSCPSLRPRLALCRSQRDRRLVPATSPVG